MTASATTPHTEPPSTTPVVSRAAERRAVALLLLITFFAHAAFLVLPWRQDDVVVVPDAVEHVGFVGTAIASVITQGEAPSAPGPQRLDWLFHPVPGFVWSVAGGIQGAPWTPLAFRVLTLLAQCTVVVLVFKLMRGFLPLLPATIASLIVAIDAAGFQAVSWIAAMPDLLLTLLTLAAILGQRRASLVRYVLLSVTCVALLPWTKATGFLVAPILALGSFAPNFGPMKRRAQAFLAHVLALALTTLIRAAYLGYFLPRYAEGAALTEGSLDLLRDMAWPYLLQLVAPWGLFADAQGRWPVLAEIMGTGALRPWIAATWGLVVVAAFFGHRSLRQRASMAAMALAVLVVPAIWIFHHAETFNASSRASHLVQVPMAVLIGCGIANVTQRFRNPWVAFSLAALILVPWVDAAVSNIRQELAAAAFSNIRSDAVERAAAASPDAAVALIDPRPEYASIGFTVMAERFRFPFRTSPLRVASFPSEAALIASRWLAETNQPVRLARWTRDDMVVDPITVGAMTTQLPDCVAAGVEEGFARFRPRVPMSPRSAAGLIVAFPSRREPTTVILRAVTDRGVVVREFPVDSGEATHVSVLLERDPTWSLAGSLNEVLLAPIGATVSPLPARHAAIHVRSPQSHDRLAASSTWKFELRGIPAIATSLETKFEFLILGQPTILAGITPLVRSNATESESYIWQSTAATVWTTEFPGLTPASLDPLMRTHLVPLGRREIPARVSFVAYTAQGRVATSRSDPIEVTFFVP